jgi:phosphatidylinositol alpha-1,6-mannosyltransferase
MSWVLHGASKVITISDFSAKKLIEAGVKSENIEKICPGVNTNLFHPSVNPENVIKKHNLEGRKVVLTLGRLVERKGYDYVIKSLPSVLEKVPNLVYIIAGRGLYESRLRELVKELHLEDYVIFAGYVDESPAYYYNACDVFIMANRRLETEDTEGFGIVFTEANACGKPVIGGKAGGTSDAVLDGYTGILVDGTDCAQISSALIDILTDKELANQLGSNGRKRVEAEFNWKRNAERIWDICLKALHSKE